jgi:hypothetical protein
MVIHLTAICGLQCCLVVPSANQKNSHERCTAVSLDNVILATTCTSTENKINTCTMILNIIYLLKNSHIRRGNLSKGGEGGSMRPYCQNSRVCIKSFYCIPLDENDNDNEHDGISGDSDTLARPHANIHNDSSTRRGKSLSCPPSRQPNNVT